MSKGENYEREIRQQPAALRRLLAQGRKSVDRLAQGFRDKPCSYGVFAARGSSDNAARYGQYVLGIQNGLTVALAAPSVFTLYEGAPDMRGALVMGVSQSGQSPDIVSVLAHAKNQGALTAAITNEPSSPLAQCAAHTIELRAGIESAVAATKTYTTELMALAMISTALAQDEVRFTQLAQVASYVEKTIVENSLVSGLEAFATMTQLVVLGRGYNYSTAFETALKIKETSHLVAAPYSVADLLHGPVAMIGDGFVVLLVSPRGKAHGDAAEVVQMVRQRNARLIAISDDPMLLAEAELALRLPEMPEWLSPIAAAVSGQLFAGALARQRGLDPDQPRGLNKVTLTH